MTSPAVTFPNAVEVGLDRLRSELPALLGEAVPVGNRVPDPRPARFVRLSRTGGPRKTPVSDGPLLYLEAWGPDDHTAEALAQAARTALSTLPGQHPTVPVYRYREASGPQDFPDPASSQSRYVFAFELHLRGRAA